MEQKKCLIILADGFEEIEAITPIDILRRAGINVTIAGLRMREIKGSHGITLLADTVITDCGKDFDACILPGGMPGAENLASNDQLRSLLLDFNRRKKIIAAICASPAVVLAPLGILDDRCATCYPSDKNQLLKATHKDKPVVIDGNIITGKAAGTALPFALAIAKKLAGKEISDKVKGSIFA